MKFTELISLVSNLCTIAAFIIALRVWWTWKNQQNYSFTRDKIFELELAVSELYNYEVHYVINITNALIHHRNGLHDRNVHAVKDQITSKKYLRDKLLEYDLKLNSLKILKVKIDTELFVDALQIHKCIEDKLEKIYLPQNSKHIELLRDDLISRVEESKTLMLNSLEFVRKDI